MNSTDALTDAVPVTSSGPPRWLGRRPCAPETRVAVLSISSPADPGELEVGLDALRFAGSRSRCLHVRTRPGQHAQLPGGRRRLRVATCTPCPDSIRASRASSSPPAAQARSARSRRCDFDRIAGAAPKVLAGYSDVTAVLEAVGRKLGWASLMCRWSIGGPDFGALLVRLDAAEPDAPGTGDGHSLPGGFDHCGRHRRRRDLGGCLTLLPSSIGTDSSWPAEGGILLIEDDRRGRLPDRPDAHPAAPVRVPGRGRGLIAGTFENCGDPAESRRS